MREDDAGRGAVQPWRDAPGPARFAVGDTVYSGECAGRVVSLDLEHDAIGIVWSDGDGGAITYPMDATYLRKEERFPWQ